MLDKVIRITEKKHKEHKKYEKYKKHNKHEKGVFVFLVLLVDSKVAKIGFIPLIFQKVENH